MRNTLDLSKRSYVPGVERLNSQKDNSHLALTSHYLSYEYKSPPFETTLRKAKPSPSHHLPPSTSRSLALQMPLHHLPKNALPTTLNHIPMTGNNLIKIPAIDPLHALRECLPVLDTRHIPQEPALPLRIALRIHQADEHSRQPSRPRPILGPRVLFVRRQVEDQVRFDERLLGFVADDELLVRVAADVLVVEFAVEVRVNAGVEFVLLGPGDVEFGAG